MNKFYSIFLLLTILICSSGHILNAQVNTGKLPYSVKNNISTNDIDHLIINPPSMEMILAEDARDEKNGEMMKVARLLPVGANTENAGTWEKADNGTDIWRLKISSEGAKSCVIHFDEFTLPSGSEFFVYNPDRSVILGPYTSNDNIDGSTYAIGIIYGSEMILEYSSSASKSVNNLNEKAKPVIEISDYSYFYRGHEMFDYRSTGYGASDDCQVNANCAEGNNWRTQQKGIARIYVRQGITAGYCSGTLVNNTNNDQTPYFLTADHCGGDATTSDMGQWIFKFNYESPSCTATSQPTGNSITGCTKVSRAPLDGGSDFLLLELNTTSTNLKNIGAVYNGWRNTTTASPSGICFHHPSGDIKKISTYTSTLGTTTYYGQYDTGATNAHWRVYWAETNNGHGVTEGGSSGSPIFDNNGLVVGTLSGGSSTCDATSSPDLYGKMSYHWTSNGSNYDAQLKHWLDPSGTATSCEYLDPNDVGIVCDFNGSPTTVNAGGTVTFTDLSSGGTVTSRTWSFPGGSPSSSASASPVITYNTAGTYNVTLTVYTSSTNATETKAGYINVTQPGSGFTYDFEDCTNFAVDQFSPCTTYDGDGSVTYPYDGIDFTNEEYTGSFIAFTPSATTPAAGSAWSPHGGLKYGACFAAKTPSNNDWFRTPQISMNSNSSLSFWAKSVSNTYGLERFNVYVSTTDNNIGSFTKISSGSYIEAPTSWTQYTYNLNAYNNQNIYIAIQCVSNDAYVFAIDDIVVSTQAQTVTTPVANFYGTPTSGCAPLTVNFYDQSTNSPSSRSWSFPGGTPSSSTSQNPIVVYNNPGVYNVTLTVANAGGNDTYSRTSYITANDCSPVEQNPANKISVFPNPTDGILNINIPENKANIRISNILGKEVKSVKLNSNENQIDISSLTPGMYFIEIQLSESKITSKITVK